MPGCESLKIQWMEQWAISSQALKRGRFNDYPEKE
jgi:hypothetical protein